MRGCPEWHGNQPFSAIKRMSPGAEKWKVQGRNVEGGEGRRASREAPSISSILRGRSASDEGMKARMKSVGRKRVLSQESAIEFATDSFPRKRRLFPCHSWLSLGFPCAKPGFAETPKYRRTETPVGWAAGGGRTGGRRDWRPWAAYAGLRPSGGGGCRRPAVGFLRSNAGLWPEVLTDIPNVKNLPGGEVFDGRGGGIRTHGLFVPNETEYRFEHLIINRL